MSDKLSLTKIILLYEKYVISPSEHIGSKALRKKGVSYIKKHFCSDTTDITWRKIGSKGSSIYIDKDHRRNMLISWYNIDGSRGKNRRVYTLPAYSVFRLILALHMGSDVYGLEPPSERTFYCDFNSGDIIFKNLTGM